MAKDLTSISAERVSASRQAALMRLQLYLVLRTHEFLRETLAACRDALEESGIKEATEPGQWDGLAAANALESIARAWTQQFADWRELFLNLRNAAAAIPLGSLAVLHASAFADFQTDGAEPVSEAVGAVDLDQAVFKPQLQAVVDAAANRVWDDGFKLSQRIWRLEQESLDGIRQVIYKGLADGQSAWQMGRELELFLGAGGGCPRWARSRLYGLTKKDIASGDRTGLYSGDECDAQGVAYKALRLARNEIQIAHHLATDAILSQVPWIEQEQVNLSPAHPEPDVCDELVNGGENGDGVYPKGTVLLPAHVQCSPAGQMIETRAGQRPIETVEPGDEVRTHADRWQPVTASHAHAYAGTVIKVVTTSGKRITVTPEHPLLVNGEWQPVSAIKVGDHVRIAD
jgi:hypothetical protein